METSINNWQAGTVSFADNICIVHKSLLSLDRSSLELL